MDYKRSSELEYGSRICKMLVELHPEHFVLETYLHPVHGESTSLKIINLGKSIDTNNIVSISVDLDSYTMVVKTKLPNNSFTITNLVKDETVI